MKVNNNDLVATGHLSRDGMYWVAIDFGNDQTEMSS